MKRSMVFHRGLLETKMEEIPEVTKKLAPFAKKQSRNIIMEKKIRKRYHSEEAVKKALKIESFRNLTKDKVMEFTSINEQIQNIAQKKDTLCRRMYN